MEERSVRISTGIPGLDRSLDDLRRGDIVAWQIESIGDYVYVATQFVADEALTGRRIVYLRFGDHEELIPVDALEKRGVNMKQYVLDPAVGFETFAVQVHRIISSEAEDSFFLFDCISELQKHWFSDSMVCNFFVLTSEFIRERGALCYVALRYERHTYETISRIRAATSVLLNIRTMGGQTYIHPVKVGGRSSAQMFLPLRVHGTHSELITSSQESYAIFDIFTQIGEKRDCWDSMFDSVSPDHPEPTDPDGAALKENIMKCLLGTEHADAGGLSASLLLHPGEAAGGIPGGIRLQPLSGASMGARAAGLVLDLQRRDLYRQHHGQRRHRRLPGYRAQAGDHTGQHPPKPFPGRVGKAL